MKSYLKRYVPIKNRVFPQSLYKLMLIAATVIWGLSFVFMKEAVEVLPPSYLVGIRFVITALLLALLFRKQISAHHARKDVRAGLILGALFFAGFWFQTVGLAHTTPAKNAFLTSIYCVIVPFMVWGVTRKKPSLFNFLAAFLCVAGIGCVSLKGDLSVQYGDYMTLISGIVFAAQIVAVSMLTNKDNVLPITIYQLGFCGLLGLICAVFTESLPSIESLDGEFFFDMIYIIVMASMVAMVFMNIGIAHVPSSQASLYMSLEAVFGVLFSVVLYGEVLTIRLLLGFALIFVAIVISEIFPLKEASCK